MGLFELAKRLWQWRFPDPGLFREEPSLTAPRWLSAQRLDRSGAQAEVALRWLAPGGAPQIQVQRRDGTPGFAWWWMLREDSARLSLKPGRYLVRVRKLCRHKKRLVYSPASLPLELDVAATMQVELRSEATLLTIHGCETREGTPLPLSGTEASPPPGIFIGGAPRSGTTLLQSVLCADSGSTPLLPEAIPLRGLVEAYEMSVRNAERFDAAFGSTDEILELFKRPIENLKAHLSRLYAAETVVVKLPELTRLIPQMLDLMPRDLFICMLRDPRAAIASMIVWGEKARARGESHMFQQRDIEALTRYFNAFYGWMLTGKERPLESRILFVRYEDLVREPEAVAERLRAFTGLRLDLFDPSGKWADVKIDLDDETSPIRDALTAHYGRPISKEPLEAWRKVLSEAEAELIEVRCGPFMRRYGYLEEKQDKSLGAARS